VISEPLPSPTLASLGRIFSQYPQFTGDQAVAAAWHDLGGEPDPADPAHAARLRILLNQWTCRIGYPPPGQPDVFVGSLANWWADTNGLLPTSRLRLAQLTDAQLQAVGRGYAELYRRPAAVSRSGTIRSFGPTATAKLLYFLRPLAITAWDHAISVRTGHGGDGAAFLRHLTTCRGWARELEAEARRRRLEPAEIGPSLGRPGSSVAKLIDEWLWATITGTLVY
jgi:hypothetical protein